VVRIRMSRIGRPHRPFYRISAVDSRVKRDGVVLESLGWYNPVAAKGEKDIELKIDRIKHWLSVGAQPSDTVRDMLAKNNVLNQDAWKAQVAERADASKKGAEKRAAIAAQPKKKEDAKG